MSRTHPEEAAPTLIIPQGTRIEVDAAGQLSISAPGNLVVQNSGKYGMLESASGSIRIDRGVEVEVETIRCADTCYVQGFLTAWKVSARSLQLGDNARAHVVLQETERLEIGRNARLVGNFSSEKEMFGLFSRFAQQVRSLPFRFNRQAPPAKLSAKPERKDPLDETIIVEGRTLGEGEEPPQAAPVPAPVLPKPLSEFPELLLFARILLEREAEEKIHPPIAQRAMEEIVKLLQAQDVETLGLTWRTLFGRIAEPREDARRARELVAEHYTGAAG
jgi:hypothetical protein